MRLSTRIFLVVAVFAALGGAAIIAQSRSVALVPRPEAQDPETQPAAPAKTPRLVVEKYEHTFGEMDVGEQGRHDFVVRNAGEADLTLETASTTCKCTLAQLTKAVVPPGESTVITLEWRGEEPQELFQQGARFHTNDPQNKGFGLGVLGRIRTRMAINPDLVYFREIPRNSERVVGLTLFSQSFRNVRLIDVRSTHPFVSVKPTDAKPTEVFSREARYSQTLAVVCRTGRELGPFQGDVIIRYAVDDPRADETERTFQFNFLGETVGDVSLHGRDVVGRMLNFGPVSQGLGAKRRAYLHVRGDDADFRPQIARVSPSFLHVEIGPPQRLNDRIRRYPVDVAIPPGTPQALLADGTAGSVAISTAHPDHPEVRFQVSAVVGP